MLGFEVILAEHDVGVIHSQTLLGAECLQRVIVQRGESVQRLDLGGDGELHLQGGTLLKGGLAGLDRVDDILFNSGQIIGSQLAVQQIDAGRADIRALALTQQLDALAGRVGALVKLAGQILDRKDRFGLGQGVVGHIHRRLAEHGGDGLLEQRAVDTLDIIAVQKAQAGQIFDADQIDKLMEQTLCFAIKAGLLLNINTIYHTISS